MSCRKLEPRPTLLFAILALMFLATSTLAATPKGGEIYRFKGGPDDGNDPLADLIADHAGNLYGTTFLGGECPDNPSGCGTVFEMFRPTSPGGNWHETMLYTFQGGADGKGPIGALVFDQAGNLYGTTSTGGGPGNGTVFELSPPAETGGAWSKTVIYSFDTSDGDGSWPTGSLVFDKAGNLYGTTSYGGILWGTVFQLSPPSSPGSGWTETVIYSFNGTSNGSEPNAGVTIDDTGALYGTTQYGGRDASHGIVFKLVPPTVPKGTWTESILYAFGGQSSDGRYPSASLIFDGAGNLYGTTSEGGSNSCTHSQGCGTVFQLSRPSAPGGTWIEMILHNFAEHNDGNSPTSKIIFDANGALYGTTSTGGGNDSGGACLGYGCGVVFRLLPSSTPGANWTEQVLHSYGSYPGDGIFPSSGLLRVGNVFYGVTEGGGNSACGCGIVSALRVSPQ